MEKNLFVEILIGVPASGKSTYSTEYVRRNPDTVRVGRDEFRFMLKNAPVCEPKIEDAISNMLYHAIDVALSKKLNVIVDNTHLRRDYIDQLVKHVETRADVRFRVFDVSLDKAIERDNTREKKVGENVLKKMYKQFEILRDTYDYQNQSKKKHIVEQPVWNPKLDDVYIFDIDGTIAHMNGKRGPFDWENVFKDDVDHAILKLIYSHIALKHKIFFVSGRDESARKATEDWLNLHNITYEALYMRKKDNYDKDTKVKKEIFETHFKDKYNIIAVYDDRQQVVDMWRGLGIKCLQVAKGDF